MSEPVFYNNKSIKGVNWYHFLNISTDTTKTKPYHMQHNMRRSDFKCTLKRKSWSLTASAPRAEESSRSDVKTSLNLLQPQIQKYILSPSSSLAVMRRSGSAASGVLSFSSCRLYQGDTGQMVAVNNTVAVNPLDRRLKMGLERKSVFF